MGGKVSKTDKIQKLADALYHFNQGERYYRYGDYERATEHFESAAMSDSTNSMYHRSFAGILTLNADRKDEAIKHYKKALELDPKNIRATYGLARQEHPDMQSKEYQQVIKKVIKFKAKTFDDYIAKAYVYEDQGDIENCILMTQKALELRKEPGTSYNLAIDFAEQKNFGAAIKAYQDAVAWDPEYSQAWDQLAVTYKMLEQYSDAIPCYHKALAIHPNNPAIHCSLGQALYWSGDEKAAIESFELAFELNKNPENSKNLNAASRAFVKDVLSHERAELLERFKEIDALRIEPIQTADILDPQEAVEAQKFNAKAAEAQEATRKFKDDTVQSFDESSGVKTPSLEDYNALKAVVYSLQADALTRDAEKTADKAEKATLTKIKSFEPTYHYHHGLVSTFMTGYLASCITIKGTHSVDTSHLGITIAATAASFAPIGGSAISNGIKTAYAAVKTANTKKAATHVYSIADTPVDCDKLVMHLSTKLTLHPKTLDALEHINEPKANQSIFSALMGKLVQFGSDFSAKINGIAFPEKESQKGRDDALKILAAIEEGTISKEFGQSEDSLIDMFCRVALSGDGMYDSGVLAY